jgi:hypothetical protein
MSLMLLTYLYGNEDMHLKHLGLAYFPLSNSSNFLLPPELQQSNTVRCSLLFYHHGMIPLSCRRFYWEAHCITALFHQQ